MMHSSLQQDFSIDKPKIAVLGLNPHAGDEGLIGKQEAIILSMTSKERDNPKIIDGSRKKRIANGSGTDIAFVNKLLKQHKMMTGMMKRMSQGGGRNFGGLDGIPPELFNNLK